MSNSNNQKPVVLVIAGHDPSGGAGIQADIESIASTGCHAASIITSLTTQNTSQVVEVLPQDPIPFRNQIRLILDDMEVSSCKLGMIGSIDLLEVIISELSKLNIPTVLDPVMHSTTGKAFVDDNLCQIMLGSLLPFTSCITPNTVESRALAESNDLNVAANKFLEYGTDSVLITGTHEDTEQVTNTFYTANSLPVEYHWERLPNSYHGSGCTLSSSIAAHLALGEELKVAIKKAQEYTWNTLKHGLKLGDGQSQPNRFYK